MKILFKNRFDSFESPGGDTVQMLQTKKYLEKIGLKVDISLRPDASIKDYDLVHIFNCMRPLETSVSIFQAKQENKKVALSSIYWDFHEFNIYGRSSNLEKVLYRYLDEFFVEKFKDFLRIDHDRYSFKDIFKYYSQNYKKNLMNVDIFLPNSDGEGKILIKKIYKNAKYHVVYNAIDKDIFYLKNSQNRNNNVMIAARIDPRKNILNLVKAIKNRKLNIYGSSSNFHLKYLNKIKSEINNNINIFGHVKAEELANIYNSHLIHILPSWLETPGLSQLEAAACGCNIVSTNKGSTIEYFGKMAQYCDPSSTISIKEALESSYDNLILPKNMSDYILSKYTWEKTAQQTLEAYERILN